MSLKLKKTAFSLTKKIVKIYKILQLKILRCISTRKTHYVRKVKTYAQRIHHNYF